MWEPRTYYHELLMQLAGISSAGSGGQLESWVIIEPIITHYRPSKIVVIIGNNRSIITAMMDP